MARKGLVTFKYEDEEPGGTPVGPVWIDYFGDDPDNPERSEQLDHWLTLPDARRIAEERGLDFFED
jgi:hypothetical protein